jgi:hypothetical protein
MGMWVIYAIILLVVAVVVFLFMRRTTPGTASDAKVMEQLAKAGSNLSRPHNIEFRFYFPSEQFAERVSATLRADGFQVSTQEVVQGHQYIVRAARSMVPVLSELESLRSRFDELATREGGIYDGWSAEVVK